MHGRDNVIFHGRTGSSGWTDHVLLHELTSMVLSPRVPGSLTTMAFCFIHLARSGLSRERGGLITAQQPSDPLTFKNLVCNEEFLRELLSDTDIFKP
jgi:hypothetical protein